MSTIAQLLNDLVEKKTQIEQFKTDHPEMAGALQLVENYTALFEEVCKRCQQNIPTYVPYPVYPYNPLCPPYQWTNNTTITWNAGTVDQPGHLTSYTPRII